MQHFVNFRLSYICKLFKSFFLLDNIEISVKIIKLLQYRE